MYQADLVQLLLYLPLSLYLLLLLYLPLLLCLPLDPVLAISKTHTPYVFRVSTMIKICLDI